MTNSYTAGNDPIAEEFIQGLIDKTVNKITSISSPLAIYLQGSFGRGEGTVLLEKGTNPRLWRDLDFILVYPFKESSKSLNQAQKELNTSEGVSQGHTPVDSSYISIAQLPRPVALRWRDLKMYELSTNSRHVYGKDIREDMAVRDGKIPLESGERFLLQKCMGLCKSYPHIDSEPLISNYEVSKTYIEISSALALKQGTPSADFAERIEILRDSENEVIQELLPRIKRWGEYKVRGNLEELKQQSPMKSWQQAVDDLLQVLAVFHDYSGNQLSANEQAWLEEYYTDLSTRFLSNTFSSAVAPDWPPGPITGTMGALGSLAYRTYGTIAISNGRKRSLACPLSAVYVASIAGLLGLRGSLSEEKYLAQMQKFMKLAGEYVESDRPEIWIQNLDNAYKRAAKPLYGMG